MATLVDHAPGESAVHHLQIVVTMATVAVAFATPAALLVLLVEAGLYRRVRPWFRAIAVLLGLIGALSALTSVA